MRLGVDSWAVSVRGVVGNGRMRSMRRKWECVAFTEPVFTAEGESVMWVVACTQGATRDEAIRSFKATVFRYVEMAMERGDEPFADMGKPPERFGEMWDSDPLSRAATEFSLPDGSVVSVS